MYGRAPVCMARWNPYRPWHIARGVLLYSQRMWYCRVMNIEQFKPKEFNPQLANDLRWFLDVSEKLTSNDLQKRTEGIQEKSKEQNAERFDRIAAQYGMDMTREQIQKLIEQLETGSLQKAA